MSHHQHHACIEACIQCAQECEHCADACLREANVAELAECIRLDRDCAHMCWTAAAFMSRSGNLLEDVCRLCAELCDLCGNECARHHHEHCRSCAEACRHCAEECRRMAGAAV